MLPQSYQYLNLSEGADRVGGQLRGDKECPFSGVTKSCRVWRKVPESDARSVGTGQPVQGRYGEACTVPLRAKYGQARGRTLPVRALTMPVHAPYGHVYGADLSRDRSKCAANL